MTPKGDRAKGNASLPANFTVEYSILVLEAVFERVEDDARLMDDYHKRWVLMLVEGSKAILERHKQKDKDYDREDSDAFVPMAELFEESEQNIIALAKAYAPRMLEAGMTLPDATNR